MILDGISLLIVMLAVYGAISLARDVRRKRW